MGVSDENFDVLKNERYSTGTKSLCTELNLLPVLESTGTVDLRLTKFCTGSSRSSGTWPGYPGTVLMIHLADLLSSTTC